MSESTSEGKRLKDHSHIFHEIIMITNNPMPYLSLVSKTCWKKTGIRGMISRQPRKIIRIKLIRRNKRLTFYISRNCTYYPLKQSYTIRSVNTNLLRKPES